MSSPDTGLTEADLAKLERLREDGANALVDEKQKAPEDTVDAETCAEWRFLCANGYAESTRDIPADRRARTIRTHLSGDCSHSLEAVGVLPVRWDPSERVWKEVRAISDETRPSGGVYHTRYCPRFPDSWTTIYEAGAERQSWRRCSECAEAPPGVSVAPRDE